MADCKREAWVEVEVDGRRAIRLRSGRVVWRDEARQEWGEFVSRLRPWHAFATLTYDQQRYGERVQALRSAQGYSDGIAEVVPLDSTIRHFERWHSTIQRNYILGPTEYVDAVEFQKNGWAHHHALLSLPGGVRRGDFESLGQVWFRDWGYARIEIPRSITEVCEYAAKYLAKDVNRGTVLLSSGLEKVGSSG